MWNLFEKMSRRIWNLLRIARESPFADATKTADVDRNVKGGTLEGSRRGLVSQFRKVQQNPGQKNGLGMKPQTIPGGHNVLEEPEVVSTVNLSEHFLDSSHPPIEGRGKTRRGRPKASPIDREKVRSLRGDLSQEAFCRRCHISPDTLQLAERGLATDNTVVKICDYAKRKGVKLTPQELKLN